MASPSALPRPGSDSCYLVTRLRSYRSRSRWFIRSSDSDSDLSPRILERGHNRISPGPEQRKIFIAKLVSLFYSFIVCFFSDIFYVVSDVEKDLTHCIMLMWVKTDLRKTHTMILTTSLNSLLSGLFLGKSFSACLPRAPWSIILLAPPIRVFNKIWLTIYSQLWMSAGQTSVTPANPICLALGRKTLI